MITADFYLLAMDNMQPLYHEPPIATHTRMTKWGKLVRDLCDEKTSIQTTQLGKAFSLKSPSDFIKMLQEQRGPIARPEHSFSASSGDVMVIGDVHGDLTLLLVLLDHMGLLNNLDQPEHLRSGCRMCVLVGDFLDGKRMGADEHDLSYDSEEIYMVQIIIFLGIRTVIGNHELMRVGLDDRYCSEETQHCTWGARGHQDDALAKCLAAMAPVITRVDIGTDEHRKHYLLMHTLAGDQSYSLDMLTGSLATDAMEDINNSAFMLLTQDTHLSSLQRENVTKAVWGRNAATGNCNGVDRFVEACKCDAVHTTIIVGHTVTSIDKTDTLCHRHTPAVASVLSADKAMSKAFLTFKKSAGHYEPGMQDNVSRDLMYWKLTNTGAVPVHLRSEPRRPESPSIGMLLGVI